ncbi:hypothetical protein T07_13665 [Trichinella nelsoni]|uniref:Uncharacterized protein n=1 Tax=Trichinella nelsoni TaxID=6336 RepID=A0A0V0SAW5_9BILA|nr:hypothetical protein T07_13665 [Trichinella nelsoni]
MLLTAILVVIILALIYHFVTQKKQISDRKETQDQRMTAIPEKKTPEEIIKESKEQQLKADKKQVGKTKKKTKSKKSKKAISKRKDMSKEKSETKKEIEMAESSPETISKVAETRNVVPQIVPNIATEEITKAAEKIRREDSEKKKRKLKRKSKSKKGREIEKEISSEITISPSSLVDCIIGFLKGGKVSTFDNPITTLITVAITVNQNQTKC